MNNQLPSFSEFADDTVTEGEFKGAVNKLLLYLKEAIGSNGENMNTLPASTGSGVKPVYTNASKQLVASSSTVGSTKQPVYMNAGTITKCSETVGSVSVPVYLNGGVITACNSIAGFVKTDNGSLQVGSVVLAAPSTSVLVKRTGETDGSGRQAYAQYDIANGANISGSSLVVVTLRPVSGYGDHFDITTRTLSGTWRNISGSTLGYHSPINPTFAHYRIGMYQRIA